MSRADQLDDAYGKAVYTSNKYIVRVREDKDGVHVFIHKRGYILRDNMELLPRGYMLGSNAAWLKE